MISSKLPVEILYKEGIPFLDTKPPDILQIHRGMNCTSSQPLRPARVRPVSIKRNFPLSFITRVPKIIDIQQHLSSDRKTSRELRPQGGYKHIRRSLMICA